jgi:hypothetical protein
MGTGDCFLGVKRPRRVADHLLPTAEEADNECELYLNLSTCLYGVCMDNFVFFDFLTVGAYI